MNACRALLFTALFLITSCNYRVVAVDSPDHPAAKERTVIYIYEKNDAVGQSSYIPMGLPSGQPFGPPPEPTYTPPVPDIVDPVVTHSESLADNPGSGLESKVVCKPFVLPKHPQMPPIPQISAKDQEDSKLAAQILVGTLGKIRSYVRKMVQTNEDAYLDYRRNCKITDSD